LKSDHIHPSNPPIDPAYSTHQPTAAIQHPKHNPTNTTTTEREIMAYSNNILKIDVSDVQSATFSISINVNNAVDQVQFVDHNRDSHTVELHNDDEMIYIRVTPRDITPEVEPERDGSTAIGIKREEREVDVEVQAVVEAADDLHIVGGDGPLGEVRLGELGLSPTRALPKKEEDADRGVDMRIAPWTPPESLGEEGVGELVEEEEEEEEADDILLIVDENGLASARNMRPEELGLGLSPARAESVEEEAAGMRMNYAPFAPEVDMFAAEPPHAEVDSADEEAAADTPAHKHDTRYQRSRQRQRHRDSVSPSRFHSRPYLHRQPAIPPRQRERLQRIARAALRVLDG
jgi:hypothetical protein